MKGDTQKLAIRAIKLVEEAFEKNFGLTLQIGAELEFDLVAKPGHKYNECSTDNNALGITGQKLYDYIPAKDRPENEKPEYFRDSPYISCFYIDTRHNELVFSHLAEHNSPVVLGRAIEAAKKEIVRKADSYGIERVSFDSSTIPCPKALQINVSLLDEEGRNILGEGTGDRPKEYSREGARAYGVADHVRKRMYEVLQESMVLLESYDRHKYGFLTNPEKFEHTVGVKTNTIDDHYDVHVENRLPGSDADPFMAIAVTLLGLYHVMNKGVDVKDGAIKFRSSRRSYKDLVKTEITTDRDVAIQQLEKGNIMRNILNNLSGEEKLGNRFHAAVLANAKQPQQAVSQDISR